jgi:hypothetical protein
VNTKHSIIYKKIGEEINNPFNRNMKRQLAKKILYTCLVLQYLMFLSQQTFSKSMMWSEKCFGISFTFGNGESFTLTVCGEHVIKTFDHAFYFLLQFPS